MMEAGRLVLGWALIATTSFASGVAEDPPPSLRGSPASMVQQNRIAQEHGLAFYQTEGQIRAAAERGELVELPGNENYEVADFVDLPYLHPQARTFVERTARLYREGCGEPLVVTSAVRPIAGQPSNAHPLSVHPAGMAVDLRVSQQLACREWLEQKLLELEEQRVINGIREFRPPHYHIAVFPEPYARYVAAQPALEPPGRVAEPPTARPVRAERSGALLVVLLGIAALIAVGW